MIKQSINKYEKPTPIYQQSTVYYYPIPTTDDQKKEKINNALIKVWSLGISKGDLITTIHGTEMRVIGFVENTKDITWYKGNPCVMLCNNSTSATPYPIKYSLEEMDITSHKPQTTQE